MLSVIHVLSSLQLGGAERFVIDLARLQRENGLDAKILSLGSKDDPLVDEILQHHIPLTLCSYKNRIKHYLEIYSLFTHVDVIHIHSPYALRFLAPLIVLFPRKRKIYTRHGLRPLDAPSWRRLHRLLKLFLYRISFVTEAGMIVFKENYGWNSDKLCVIENGAYVPDNVEISIKQPVRIGSVGRMVELKGQRFLLQSIRDLENQSISNEPPCLYELHFFGTGPIENELREEASKLQCHDNVYFHGVIIDRDEIYNNMDILVVSSETEGLSLAIMEAMARGVCVIATDVGGNSRLVHSGINGFLIPYGDRIEMRKAIYMLIKDAELIEKMGKNARKFVQENYSLYNTHLAYLKCYSE